MWSISERADLVREVHNQIAGFLGRLCTVRVPRHPKDVHPPGRHFRDEQHIQAPQEDRVHSEAITREQALRLSPQEPPLGGIQATGNRPVAPRTEDPPHSRLAHTMTEARQLALHPTVSPGGILRRQQQSLLGSNTRSWR